jgi:assimilatory nitrate reductase electron transfer subunit
MTRLVVVGNGMVGSRFVEDLLAADTARRFHVTVLGAEDCEPYNRVLLSEVLAGKHDLASLTLPTPQDPRLRVLRGSTAVELDRQDRAVVGADGSRHRYDLAVLATGAAARVPPVRGLGSEPGSLPGGVHALRTIDDAREIVAATLNARRAVVLGAGVLGLEAACGLARRGVPVTVVHPADALMERQLDQDASGAVEAAMRQIGIDHRLGVGAQEVVLDGGRLSALRLTDGEVVEADLLVLSTGTIANTSLAERAGLPTGRGILVDDALSSVGDRRVFAIGDCAQPPEGGTGLVAQGWEQSRRLAAGLTGGRHSSAAVVADRGSDVVRLKAHGLDVIAMGVCGSGRAPEPGQRELRLSDPASGRHVEVVVSGGVLVGATCVGAGPLAADLVAAYTRRTPVPADPAYLLLKPLVGATAAPATSPTALPDDATVCRCNGVSKGDITQQWHEGACTLGEIASTTRATTGCGGCTDAVCGILASLERGPGGSRAPQTTGENRFTNGKHMLHPQETAAP